VPQEYLAEKNLFRKNWRNFLAFLVVLMIFSVLVYGTGKTWYHEHNKLEQYVSGMGPLSPVEGNLCEENFQKRHQSVVCSGAGAGLCCLQAARSRPL
jgi:hypothetical protein